MGGATVSRLTGLISSASDYPPPPIERLAAGGKVLLRCADALQEREGVLAQRLALVAELSVGVALLVGVTREIIELGRLIRAARISERSRVVTVIGM